MGCVIQTGIRGLNILLRQIGICITRVWIRPQTHRYKSQTCLRDRLKWKTKRCFISPLQTYGLTAKSLYSHDGAKLLQCCMLDQRLTAKSLYTHDGAKLLQCCMLDQSLTAKSLYTQDGAKLLQCCMLDQSLTAKSLYTHDGARLLECCMSYCKVLLHTRWSEAFTMLYVLLQSPFTHTMERSFYNVVCLTAKSLYTHDGAKLLQCCMSYCKVPLHTKWSEAFTMLYVLYCKVSLHTKWSEAFSMLYVLLQSPFTYTMERSFYNVVCQA